MHNIAYNLILPASNQIAGFKLTLFSAAEAYDLVMTKYGQIMESDIHRISLGLYLLRFFQSHRCPESYSWFDFLQKTNVVSACLWPDVYKISGAL